MPKMFNLNDEQTITNTLFKKAVDANDLVMARFILEKSVPNNIKDCLRNTSLSEEMMELLKLYDYDLDVSVDVILNKAPDPPAPRPLVVHKRILYMVPGCNDKRNINESDDNSTFMIMLQNHPLIAYDDLLRGIISKAEINHKNSQGWTALHYVCRNARLIPNGEVLVHYLLNMGADINALTNANNTPLLLAVGVSKTDSTEGVVKRLLEHEMIDINIKQIDGNSALYRTCKNLHLSQSSIETVRMLLKKPGIDLSDSRCLPLLVKYCRQYGLPCSDMVLQFIMFPNNKNNFMFKADVLRTLPNDLLIKLFEDDLKYDLNDDSKK